MYRDMGYPTPVAIKMAYKEVLGKKHDAPVKTGPGYVKVGSVKLKYWSKEVVIDIPDILAYSLVSAAIVGTVWALLSRWQIDEQTAIIEKAIAGQGEIKWVF